MMELGFYMASTCLATQIASKNLLNKRTRFAKLKKKHLLKQKELNLQSYKDICLSCHAAVLLIKAGREFTPTQDVPLAKSDS